MINMKYYKLLSIAFIIAVLVNQPSTVESENIVANSGIPLVPAGSLGSDGAHISGFGGSAGIGSHGAYAGRTHTGQHHGRPYRSAQNAVANSGVPLVPAGSLGSDGAHISGFGGSTGIGKHGAYAGGTHAGQHHGRPYRSAENLVANSGVPLVPAGSLGSDGAHISGFGGSTGIGKHGAYAGGTHEGQHHGRPYRSAQNAVANSGVPLVPAGSLGSDGAHISGFGGSTGIGKHGAYAGGTHAGQHHGRPYRSAENLVANSGVPLVPAGSLGSDGAHISGFGGSTGIGKHGAYAGGTHAGQHHGRPYRSAQNAVANSGVPLVPAGSLGSDGAHISGFGGSTGIGNHGAYAGGTHAGQHHGRPYRSAENLVANSGVPLVPAGSIGSDGAHISGFGGSTGIGKHGAYAGGTHAGQHHGRPYRSAQNAVANSGVPLVPAGSLGSDGAHISGFGGSTGIGKHGAYAGGTHAGQHHGRPYRSAQNAVANSGVPLVPAGSLGSDGAHISGFGGSTGIGKHGAYAGGTHAGQHHGRPYRSV